MERALTGCSKLEVLNVMEASLDSRALARVRDACPELHTVLRRRKRSVCVALGKRKRRLPGLA